MGAGDSFRAVLISAWKLLRCKYLFDIIACPWFKSKVVLILLAKWEFEKNVFE
jgi:hypothetical protein